MTRRYCSAKYCRNSNTDGNLHFFRFPKDADRLALWIQNCEREDIVSKESNYCYDTYRLCSAHFEPQMFANVQKNKLLSVAVPTIFNKSPQDSIHAFNTPGTTFEQLATQDSESQDDDTIDIKPNISDIIDDKKLENTQDFIKTEPMDTENIIYIKPNVSDMDTTETFKTDLPGENQNDSNKDSSLVKNSSENLSNEGSNDASGSNPAQWIILVTSEGSKVSDTNTNPIISISGNQNMTLPSIIANNTAIPTIQSFDTSYMPQIGMPPSLAVMPQNVPGFLNPNLPVDSMNNQWIILLNSTGPSTSFTNTMSSTVVTDNDKHLFALNHENSLMPRAVPNLTVPNVSHTLPVVTSVVNGSAGLSNAIQAAPNVEADWILVVSSTAEEISGVQTTSTSVKNQNSKPDESSKISNDEMTESDTKTNDHSTLNFTAISFETKSVSSNSVSISTHENNTKDLKSERRQKMKKINNFTATLKKSNILNETTVNNRYKKRRIIKNLNMLNFLKNCKHFLSPEMLNLVQMHIYKKRNLKGRKSGPKYKKFAQKFNKISPKAFNFFIKTLKLPKLD